MKHLFVVKVGNKLIYLKLKYAQKKTNDALYSLNLCVHVRKSGKVCYLLIRDKSLFKRSNHSRSKRA